MPLNSDEFADALDNFPDEDEFDSERFMYKTVGPYHIELHYSPLEEGDRFQGDFTGGGYIEIHDVATAYDTYKPIAGKQFYDNEQELLSQYNELNDEHKVTEFVRKNSYKNKA